MGSLAVMGKEGDTKVIWDAENADEVANAKRTFDDLRKKGYMAYSVNPENAKKGELITKFDPNAQKLILAPPMAGG